MLTFAKAAFAKSFVGSLAKDNDKKTTLLGIAAGALVASQLDWGKLIQADGAECGKAAGAVVAVLIGYYTNKPSK
jgi:hypothetical protein